MTSRFRVARQLDLPIASHTPGLDTEHAAERQHAQVRRTHLTETRYALAQAGQRGLTKHELDALMRWPEVESSRRLYDLRRLGEAELLQERRCGPHGRWAHVCVLTTWRLGRELAA